MRVAVLGGGLLGCCTALALVERGVRVALYDRCPALLTRAAVANEGKIHLGYMYAGDSSLATARTMIRGALDFAPLIHRWVGIEPQAIPRSAPAVYLLHRESQRTLSEASAHLAAVHALVAEAAAGRPGDYFGQDLAAPPRRWSGAEHAEWFDPETSLAAFTTQELAVEPVALAAAVRDRVMAEAAIELRLLTEVLGVGTAPQV